MKKLTDLTLAERFQYHPPSSERARKHDIWNEMVLGMASYVKENMQEPNTVEQILNELQLLRMLGNMCITYDDLLSEE